MGDDCRELFLMAQLMLIAALPSVAVGQQQGVSLVLLGQTIPNNSLVNMDDLLYTILNHDQPTNANGQQTLMCVTDLVDCCESPRTVRGNWYYPDGRTVVYNTTTGSATFQSNRGANEVMNAQQFLGSVRLWRRFTPPERGVFYCVLPDASGVNQTLFVNILLFWRTNGKSVDTPRPSGSTTAGETYSLTCSAMLWANQNPPLPDPNIPAPIFQWSFGPNGDALLPSGVTPTETTLNSGNYTSTLVFTALSESHAGNYTCRLGAGSLVNSNTFTVTYPSISAGITPNLNTPLQVGQSGGTLTCGITGADRLNPTIVYQWTRNNGTTQIQIGSAETLILSPLTLFSAANYSCSATVSSNLLNSGIPVSAGTPQRVEIQVPDPQTVTVSISGGGNAAPVGSSVTVTCAVAFGSTVMESELSLLMVDAQMSREGTPLTLTGPPEIRGTTINFQLLVSCFSESDVGNYSCTATVAPQPSSTFLTGMGQLESLPLEIMIGTPPTLQSSSGCYSASDIAITVVATTVIECLLAAPVITAVLVLCWKRNQRLQYKSDTSTAIQAGEVNPGEDVYEEPDIKTAAITDPGKFKLMECPAYVATTNTLQPCATTEAQLQSGYYEL